MIPWQHQPTSAEGVVTRSHAPLPHMGHNITQKKLLILPHWHLKVPSERSRYHLRLRMRRDPLSLTMSSMSLLEVEESFKLSRSLSPRNALEMHYCCRYKHTGTSELTCILQPDKSVLMLGCEMFPCAEACPQERHANEFHSPVSGLQGALCEW